MFFIQYILITFPHPQLLSGPPCFPNHMPFFLPLFRKQANETSQNLRNKNKKHKKHTCTETRTYKNTKLWIIIYMHKTKKVGVTRQKRPKQSEARQKGYKNSSEFILWCLCCWSWCLPLSVATIPIRLHWRKLTSPLWMDWIRDSFLVKGENSGICVCSPVSALGPCLVWTCVGPVYAATVSEFTCGEFWGIWKTVVFWW